MAYILWKYPIRKSGKKRLLFGRTCYYGCNEIFNPNTWKHVVAKLLPWYLLLLKACRRKFTPLPYSNPDEICRPKKWQKSTTFRTDLCYYGFTEILNPNTWKHVVDKLLPGYVLLFKAHRKKVYYLTLTATTPTLENNGLYPVEISHPKKWQKTTTFRTDMLLWL